jgi:hypothetical protein
MKFALDPLPIVWRGCRSHSLLGFLCLVTCRTTPFLRELLTFFASRATKWFWNWRAASSTDTDRTNCRFTLWRARVRAKPCSVSLLCNTNAVDRSAMLPPFLRRFFSRLKTDFCYLGLAYPPARSSAVRDLAIRVVATFGGPRLAKTRFALRPWRRIATPARQAERDNPHPRSAVPPLRFDPQGIDNLSAGLRVVLMGGMGRRRYTKWVGHYPPGSPADWVAAGHVTCNIQCHGAAIAASMSGSTPCRKTGLGLVSAGVWSARSAARPAR